MKNKPVKKDHNSAHTGYCIDNFVSAV